MNPLGPTELCTVIICRTESTCRHYQFPESFCYSWLTRHDTEISFSTSVGAAGSLWGDEWRRHSCFPSTEKQPLLNHLYHPATRNYKHQQPQKHCPDYAQVWSTIPSSSTPNLPKNLSNRKFAVLLRYISVLISLFTIHSVPSHGLPTTNYTKLLSTLHRRSYAGLRTKPSNKDCGYGR